MPTLVLLLSARTEARIGDLDAAAAVAVRRLGVALYATQWQRAGRLAGSHGRSSPWPATDAAYDGVLTHGLSNGVLLGGFDLALSLTVPEAPVLETILVDELAALGGHLGDGLDAERSAVAVGQVHSIKDGHAAVHLLYGMRRRAGVTHEAFSEHWLEQHSKVAVHTPGLVGYHQLHVDPVRTGRATEAAGFGVDVLDGVALEWFADIAGFVGAVGAKPEFGQAAKASEDRFNDIARATGILTQVLEAHGPVGTTA
jgi:hypothetical protein